MTTAVQVQMNAVPLAPAPAGPTAPRGSTLDSAWAAAPGPISIPTASATVPTSTAAAATHGAAPSQVSAPVPAAKSGPGKESLPKEAKAKKASSKDSPKGSPKSSLKGAPSGKDKESGSAKSGAGGKPASKQPAEPAKFMEPWLFWTRSAPLSPGGPVGAPKMTRNNWLQQLAPAGDTVQTVQQLRALAEQAEGRAAVIESMEQVAARLGAGRGAHTPTGSASQVTPPGWLPSPADILKTRGPTVLPPRPDAALKVATTLPTAGSDGWHGSLVQAFFVDGIQPAWEDPANAHGGSWSVQLSVPRPAEQVWALWFALMEAAASRKLERPIKKGGPRRTQPSKTSAPMVRGVMLSIKPRAVRFSIWTARADTAPTAPEAQEIIDVGQQLVQRIQLCMAGRIKGQHPKRAPASANGSAAKAAGGAESAPADLPWPHEVRFAPHHSKPAEGAAETTHGLSLPLISPPGQNQAAAKTSGKKGGETAATTGTGTGTSGQTTKGKKADE